MRNLLRLSLPLILTGLTLFSCATAIDQARATDPSIRIKPSPLELEPRAEVYHVRVDLVRAYHTETRTYFNGKTTVTQTVSVPNSYHYVAADFGSGIIYDYNGNLAVDLVSYFGLEKDARFHLIGQYQSGMFRPEVTYKREGKTYTVESDGPFGPGSEVQFEEKKIRINNGIFNNNLIITQSPGKVFFDPNGFFGLGKVSAEKPDNSQLTFPGFWGDTIFEILGQDQITNNRDFKVSRETDHIRFVYTGFFGITSEYVFVRTDNGFMFFDDEYYGTEVYRNGNIITVTVNGENTVIYRIMED